MSKQNKLRRFAVLGLGSLATALVLSAVAYIISATAAILALVGIMWLATFRIAASNRKELAAVRAQQESTRAGYETIIERLCGAVGLRDEIVDRETQRLSRLASVLVRQMRVPTEQVTVVEQAAALRDVGKRDIAQSVLDKREDFNERDWAEMKRHPEIGYQILKEIGFLSEVADVVRAHHERYDGQGYPHRLRGETIPLAARILAVLDAYVAMTSPRPYRKTRTPRRRRAGNPALRRNAVRPGSRARLLRPGKARPPHYRRAGTNALERSARGHRGVILDAETTDYTDPTAPPSDSFSPPAEAPQQGTVTPAPLAAPIDDFAPRFTGVLVEMVLDSYRVIGELFAPGVPRRLVDVLNSSDLSYYVMHTGALDDPFNPSAEPRSFDVIQLDRSGILFAIPRGEVHKPDPFETVRKKRVPSTVVLPGFEVKGNLHLMPDADPALVPIVSDHHFVPFTDVTITADKGSSQVWQEPLVIVNMTRSTFYGTQKADAFS